MRPSPREWNAGRLFCVAGLTVACSSFALAQKPDKKADPKADAAQAQNSAQVQEAQSMVRLVDAAMAGQPPASELPMQFQNDFLKAQGSRVWIPITLTVEPGKVSGPVTLYLRVAPRGMTTPPPAATPAAPDKSDKNEKAKKKDKNAPPAAPPAPVSNYPFEDVVTDIKPPPAGQPLRIVHGIGVPPGSYDLYIVLHEPAAAGATGAGKIGFLKQPLDVPNFSTGEFSTSSVILATRVDQLPAALTPDQQSERPYAFGQTEIIVAPDRKFKKADELIVLLQIYNPMLSPEKKFNLEANYTFFHEAPDGEKRFNSTEPQVFSSETMGPAFDPTSGNSSIQAGQGIPLQSFPEGTYRLEIKITDKLSAKVLTQNVTFTVSS